MEFKKFLLCFAVLVVATSAASVYKCEDKKEIVSKYKVKLYDGGKEYDEEIEVDTEKQIETIHIPETNSSNVGEVDVIFDFKKNVAMHRISSAQACFLSDSTEDLLKPDDLTRALEKKDTQNPSQVKDATYYDYEVVGTVDDRSDLSDEMAFMCAKLPIYRIKERKIALSTDNTKHRRFKRRVCIKFKCGFRIKDRKLKEFCFKITVSWPCPSSTKAPTTT